MLAKGLKVLIYVYACKLSTPVSAWVTLYLKCWIKQPCCSGVTKPCTILTFRQTPRCRTLSSDLWPSAPATPGWGQFGGQSADLSGLSFGMHSLQMLKLSLLFRFAERRYLRTAGSWWWRLNWSNIDVLIVVDALVIFGYWIEDPFFSFSLPFPSPSSPFISLLSFVSWALCKGKKHNNNNNSNKVDVFLCCHGGKAMFPI